MASFYNLKNLFQNKITFGLLIIFIVVLSLGMVVEGGYLPVMIVNNQIILEKKLKINTQAALTYYKNYIYILERDVHFKSPPPSFKTASYDETEVIILNTLIDRALIHNEVKKRYGKDLAELINKKIKDYLTPELEKAAFVMYNLNQKDFKNEILIPEAEKDILRGNLFLENKKIEDWLKDSRKNLSIKIFNSKFKWTGNQIELKND